MLTREEILALPAGQKMNELVAEHVLGKVWVHIGASNSLIEPSELETWQRCFDNVEMGRSSEADPVGGSRNYSTNIVQAWQVWEYFCYGRPEDLADALQAVFRIKPYANMSPATVLLVVVNNLTPLKICQAALLAKFAGLPAIEKTSQTIPS